MHILTRRQRGTQRHRGRQDRQVPPEAIQPAQRTGSLRLHHEVHRLRRQRSSTGRETQPGTVVWVRHREGLIIIAKFKLIVDVM